MAEPRALGRVDWMPRKKVWRVIWYKGATDIPAGDYPTRKEAEDALRELVARGGPTPVTQKVFPETGAISPELGKSIAAELDVIFTGIQEGYKEIPATMLFTDKQTGTTFAANSLERARTRLAEVRKAFEKPVTPEATLIGLLPEGWKTQVVKTAKGYPLAEVDWASKTIRVQNENVLKNPVAMSHEIAHVMIETHLSQKNYKTFVDDWMKASRLPKEALEEGSHIEIMSDELGKYVLGEDVDSKIKVFFMKYFPEVTVPKAEAGNPVFTVEEAKNIGKQLGIDFKSYDVEQFRQGLNVELEHCNVTNCDPLLTGKIAQAHLKELPDYYTRLAKMEEVSNMPKTETERKSLHERIFGKGSTTPLERLGRGETLNNLLPMPPEEGPPLPRMLALRWPWKK